MTDPVYEKIIHNKDGMQKELDWLDSLDPITGTLGEVFLDARVDAAERFDPEIAGLPHTLMIRLAGEEQSKPVKKGALTPEMAKDIVPVIQDEFRLSGLVDAVDLSLNLTSISAGSVLLTFLPSVEGRDPFEEARIGQLDLHLSTADNAIRRVFNFHDMIEQEASPLQIRTEFAKNEHLKSMLQTSRKLFSSLEEQHLRYHSIWKGPRGKKTLSTITQKGLSYADTLFQVKPTSEKESMSGIIIAVDLRGKIVVSLTSEGRGRTIEGLSAEQIEQAKKYFLDGSTITVTFTRKRDENALGIGTGESKYTFLSMDPKH